jgi:CHAD domain-containing protein
MSSPFISIDQPETWPDITFRDLILRITDAENLVPLFVINQERYLRNVKSEGLCIAEYCVDHFQCKRAGTAIKIMVLEIELKESGSIENLKKIAKKLERKYKLHSEIRSKYEIALAFTQIPSALLTHTERVNLEPSDIGFQDSMTTAAYKTLRYHFEVMEQNESGAYRGEDIEFVHDMRVAVRRMRTACRVFAPYLDMDGLEPFLKDLKKTGRMLGAVRDMDVFRENFEQYAIDHHLALGDSTLSASWNTAYINARNDLLRYLGSNRYMQFKVSFNRYLHQVIESCAELPKVSDDLWRLLDQYQQCCITYFNDFEQLESVPLFHYHQLRIYMKYFRYSIEYFRNLLGEKGEETITETKKIQDHLGTLQDAVVAKKYATAVLHWGSWLPPKQPYTLIATVRKPTKDVEAYLSYTQAAINQLTVSFPAVWKSFIDFLAGNPLQPPV